MSAGTRRLADPAGGQGEFGDRKVAAVNLISAHEIGHLMNNLGHSAGSQRALDLMFAGVDGSSGCRTVKRDWNHVNP